MISDIVVIFNFEAKQFKTSLIFFNNNYLNMKINTEEIILVITV